MKKLYLCLFFVFLIVTLSPAFAGGDSEINEAKKEIALEFVLSDNEKIAVGFTSANMGSITINQELPPLSLVSLEFNKEKSTVDNRVFTGDFSVYYQIKSLSSIKIYLGYNEFYKNGVKFGTMNVTHSDSLVKIDNNSSSIVGLEKCEHILEFKNDSNKVTRTDIEEIGIEVNVPYEDVIENTEILETTFTVITQVV